MAGITGLCSRLVGDLVQALGVARVTSSCPDPNKKLCLNQPSPNPGLLGAGFIDHKSPNASHQVDDLMIRALRSVFGMETDGKIKKEKAHQVVKKLGLLYEGEGQSGFDLPGSLDGEEVPVQEVLNGMEEDDSDRQQKLLLEAFKIFDEDGDGYIDAVELKRVLECLGLDKGWALSDIEKMLKVVDLNMDGKVDFSEFELMMG